ncbi:MAG TPA: hypothetical protein VGA77_06625 [Propylenella sp.]
MSDIEQYEEFIRSIAGRRDIADPGLLVDQMIARCEAYLADGQKAEKHDYYRGELARWQGIQRVRQRLSAEG